MTEPMIDLPGLIAKSDDTDFLKDLIEDATRRLMDIEVSAVTLLHMASARRCGRTSATAIGNGHGRPARARSACRSRSCGKAPTFQPSWNHAAPPRKR